MGSPEIVDPYLDPTTGVLRNKVGATSPSQLHQAEGDLVLARSLQLVEITIPPTRDLAELCAIHRHLFQDMYAWAGQIRTVDLRKSIAGAQLFLPAAMITQAAGFAAEHLRDDGFLQGLAREQFVERIVFHYDQVNYLHPFREGNGRTQRAFWSRVARDAGWRLDWRAVTGPVNDEACRAAAEDSDFGPMTAMLERIVTKGPSPRRER